MMHFLYYILAACIYTVSAVIDSREYILELSSLSDTQSFLNNHKASIQHVRYVFDSDLFFGTAIQFKDEKLAKRLIKQEKVVKAWPIHHRARTHAPVIQIDASTTQANTLYPQNENTLKLLTQANYFNELKSKGAGIKIGIIDTGVDYTHPALGGCFGNGCKIAYGYDLVGNAFDGSSKSIKESSDPLDDCPTNSTSATGHGTFVSGIIGADDKIYNWTGVAPEATLGMWRVYGCNYASSPSDVLLKAMEMAYKADMDIISMSLGVSGGWEEDVLSVAADRLVSKGVHVITASGNSGTSGLFLTASPASGKDVIAVGSTMNSHVPGYILKLISNNNEADIYYRTSISSALDLDRTLKIVASGTSFDQSKDACKPLNGMYNETVMLIHRGDCSVLTKVQNAKNAGAAAVIIYTDEKNQTTSVLSVSNAVLPVAFINHDDGSLIYKQIDKESSVRFTKTLVALAALPSEHGMVSGYSTLGPTNELKLKPELVAVGGNVFSTLPRYLNMYGFRSGTSFSAPYIAGNVALLLSNVKRTIKPDYVKNLLMNFATQVNKPISAMPYGDSPIRQGAGVVDVVQAIHGYEQFHVTPAVLALNDSAHFTQDQSITIHNHQDTELTFTIDHMPSLTVTGYSLKNVNFTYTPVEPIGLYTTNVTTSVASLEFSTTSLVVPAGESRELVVRISPPVDTFKSKWHVLYGGYITVRSTTTSAEAYVPYMGMIGNMKDLPILDRTSNPSVSAKYDFPSIGLPNGRATVQANETGTFHIKTNQHGTISGGPYVLVRLLTGTSMLQIQILDEHNVHVGDLPMSASTHKYMMRNTLSLTEYSQAYYTWYWTSEYVSPNATLTNVDDQTTKYLESGIYQLKIRGLSVFGDMENPNDWDEWISPKLNMTIDLVNGK